MLTELGEEEAGTIQQTSEMSKTRRLILTDESAFRNTVSASPSEESLKDVTGQEAIDEGEARCGGWEGCGFQCSGRLRATAGAPCQHRRFTVRGPIRRAS